MTDASTSPQLRWWRILSSEFFKFRTLKANLILEAAIFTAIVGLGAMAAAAAAGDIAAPVGGPPVGGNNPVETVVSGANVAVLLVAVAGVLTGAREHTSHLIAVTMAAVPRRLGVLWSKLVVFTTWTATAVVAGTVIAFFTGTAILAGAGKPSAGWADPGVPRAVLGTAATVVGFGLIGVGLGMLTRSVAGGLATLLGGVLILPALASVILPSDWAGVLKYLPTNAAASFSSLTAKPAMLSPGAGAAVFCVWIVVAIAAAAIVLKQRDI